MVKSNITIEGARIGFRNFSGKEGRFNPAGRRNFCVFLDEELASTLEKDGWNVRWLEPRDEGDAKQPYLQVAVSFSHIVPKIVLVTSHGKTILDEDSIGLIDFAELKNVDLVIRPYNWTISEGTKNQKSGVKAYVKTMYITIAEDEFEDKYYDVPDSAANTMKDDEGD